MSTPHLSVLYDEVLATFADQPIKVFVDGTLGAGGHASGLLEAHPEIESFVGIDQDPAALALAQERLAPWQPKLRLVHANFDSLSKLNIAVCDGILLDIGVSSMQLDTADRGFSINRPGPLDMRMNPNSTLTAQEIVNTWSDYELGRIFRDYGEEKRWRAAARAIVAARQQNLLTTTEDLVNILMPVLRDPRSHKSIHPLTLVFQALRIAVNDELGVLESALKQAIDLLAPGGRLAVISFHSLEDRIVKQFFRYLASDKENTLGIAGVFIDKAPIVKLLTRKAIAPTDEEIKRNPRARSARLRTVEKL